MTTATVPMPSGPRLSIALLAAVLIPFGILWVLVILNDTNLERESLQQRALSFDVEKQQPIVEQQRKPKPKPKPQRPLDTAPALTPLMQNDALSMGGLSFGVPQFNESDYGEFADQSLLDAAAGEQSEDSLDTRPRVLKRSPIVYPELARKQGISGYVTLNVLINEYGDVEDVQIIDSEPVEIFDLQAETTVRRWKFEPATYNGRKVKTWAVQKIAFQLN